MYIEERKNIGKIAEILTKMGVPYKIQDIGDKQGEIFPALICHYRFNELDFDVIIYNLGRWIHVKCMVMSTQNLSSQTLLSIY